MIYQYEAEVLRFINKAVPEIVESTYSQKDSMFTSMNPIIKYPSFRYSRVSTNYQWNQSLDVRQDGQFVKLYPVEQHYIGRIYCENVAYAFDLLQRVRFFWNENAKVSLKVLDESVDVSLWLLYIKIDEERDGADKKGAMRFIEFEWKSNLLLFKDYSQLYKLVKEIRFKIVAKGVALLNENDEELVIF